MNEGLSTSKSTVLTCWKDIAQYMGKGVRTVQRWEQEFGLPVRRPLGASKKAVIARPFDLDAWVALRCGSRSEHLVPNDGSRSDSVAKLASLAAQIETSRQLRDHNRVLVSQVRLALDSLRQQVVTLYAARAAASPAPAFDSRFESVPQGTSKPDVAA